jgi:hypothetical protein
MSSDSVQPKYAFGGTPRQWDFPFDQDQQIKVATPLPTRPLFLVTDSANHLFLCSEEGILCTESLSYQGYVMAFLGQSR